MTIQITRERIVANIPQTLTIIALLLTVSAFFIKGALDKGTPATNLTSIIAMATPFAVLVSEGILARRFIRLIMRREKLVESAIFFASWIFVILIGIDLGGTIRNPLGLGRGSDLYKYMFNVVSVHGQLAMGAVGSLFALYYLMLTDLKPSRVANIIVALCAVFSFAYVTPVGDLIWPGLSYVGSYLYMYPGAVGSQIHWFAVYLGAFVLVMRAIFYMERLRGGA